MRQRYGLTWNGDPRVKPPFGSVQINQGHPLAGDMISCILLNETGGGRIIDLAAQGQVVTLVGMPWASTAQGWGVDNNSDGDEIDWQPGISVAAGSHFSDFWIVAVDTYNGGNSGGWRSGAASNGTSFHIINVAARTVYVRWNGVDILPTTGGDARPSSGLYSDGLTIVNATRASTYLNGRQDRSATHATATAAFTINNHGWQNATSERIDGRWVVRYLWRRPLSSDEHRWLHVEPYTFLRPRVYRRYFVPAAAGAATWPGWVSSRGGWILCTTPTPT